MQDIFSLNLLPIQTAIMSESTIFIYNKGVIIFGKVECSDLKCFPHYYLIRCVENILTRPWAKVLLEGSTFLNRWAAGVRAAGFSKENYET